MEETIEFYKNDIVRGIEQLIESVNKWKNIGKPNPHANPRETALVITKLEEAKMWALQMVKRPI